MPGLRRFLFADVVEPFWLDAYVDETEKRVFVDDQNLIKAMEAVLVTIPNVVGDEQGIGSALELARSEVEWLGLVSVRDVTEAGGGWAGWLNSIENPDGSIGKVV